MIDDNKEFIIFDEGAEIPIGKHFVIICKCVAVCELIYIIWAYRWYMMYDNLEFIVHGKGSDISNEFLELIVITTETHVAKLGLKDFATYNNITNIEEKKNNQIKIKVPGKENYELFSLDKERMS